MGARWDPDTTLRFVKLYRERECLWNWKCPGYMDKRIREEACQEIEAAMQIEGFGVLEIKRKIRTLRSTYSQELKKIKIAKKHDRAYCPALKWFREMHAFIRMNQQTRYHHAAVGTEDQLDEEDDRNDIESIEIKAEPLENDSFLEEEYQITPEEDEQYVFPSNEVDMLLPDSKRPKLDDNISGNISSPLLGSDYSADMKQEVLEPDDEFDIFGKHVAAQMKQLTLINALKAQAKIQLILTELRLEQIPKNR